MAIRNQDLKVTFWEWQSTEPTETDRGVAPGVHIRDDANGVDYYAVPENRPGGTVLVHLDVTADPGRAIPVKMIPQAALFRLAEQARADQLAADLDEAPPPERPSHDQLAADLRLHTTARIAEKYRVSKSSVDKWLREARETTNPATGRPYLPPAKPGRPKKSPNN